MKYIEFYIEHNNIVQGCQSTRTLGIVEVLQWKDLINDE